MEDMPMLARLGMPRLSNCDRSQENEAGQAVAL
jgi:hypothetical protein